MTDSSQRFAQLRTRYAASLPMKRAALADAWRALRAIPGECAVIELQALVHRLAGSAPAYGYPALGSQATAVDGLLDKWAKRPAAERAEASALAERLATPMRALLDGLADAIGAKLQHD